MVGSAYCGGVKDFVVYTVARLGVFAATYAVVLAIFALLGDGWPPVLWPLLIAAVISAVVSTYLLRDLRDRFSARVQSRAERMSARFEEMRAKEDQD